MPSNFEEIASYEKQVLSDLAAEWGVTLDYNEVEKFAKQYVNGEETLRLRDIPDNHNKRAAKTLLQVRNSVGHPSSDLTPEQAIEAQLRLMFAEIKYGTKLLEQNGVYWRYETTIQKILDFDTEQAKEAYDFLNRFEESDYGFTLAQQREKFLQHARYWDVSDISPKRIESGIEALRHGLGLYERGFPLLLGLKRVIDGEQPSVNNLQEMRASKVRNELTNVEKHENSVFFDMIVNSFDSTIRNALAHGDLSHDPQKQVINIPNRSRKYEYEEFQEVICQHIGIGVFLTGMFQALVQSSYYCKKNKNLSTEVIPV